jgi:FlaA1/EpsC-like NDP-sugar epimerase
MAEGLLLTTALSHHNSCGENTLEAETTTDALVVSMKASAEVPPPQATGNYPTEFNAMSPAFHRIALLRAARLFDIAVVSLTFLAALAIASGSFTWLSFGEVLSMRIKLVNLILIAAYIAACTATFASCGFYLSHRLSHWPRQLREIFIAVSFITGILLVLRRPFDFSFATNQFLFAFWFLTFAVLALARVVGQQLLYFVRSRGRNLRSIVIVGEGLEAMALADRIEQEPTLGYRVVRIIDAKEV